MAKGTRSSEELQMRALVTERLRSRYPTARIIHELPLRDGSSRLDMAAVTEREIIGVEIKSSKDVIDRLENQIRSFVPVTHRLWVCLAPKHDQKPPAIEEPRQDIVHKGVIVGYSPARLRQPKTSAQEIIERVWDRWVEVWQIDASAGTALQTEREWLPQHDKRIPWSAALLDLCWNAELNDIAAAHAIGAGSNHDVMVERLNRLLTGEQVIRGVCTALRGRAAFAAGSDPPVIVKRPTLFTPSPEPEQVMPL